jgi:hypothetical protein
VDHSGGNGGLCKWEKGEQSARDDVGRATEAKKD